MCRRKEWGLSNELWERKYLGHMLARNLICNTGSLAAYSVSPATILNLFLQLSKSTICILSCPSRTFSQAVPLSWNICLHSPSSYLGLQNIECGSLCYAVGSYLIDLCSYVRWQSFPCGSDYKEISFFKAIFYDLLSPLSFLHPSIYTLLSFFIKLLITQVKICVVCLWSAHCVPDTLLST